MNLKTSYLGLSLPHPIVAGASPLSATVDGILRLEDAGAAAIVAASVYEEEVRAEDAAFEASAMIGAESNPEVTSYIPPLPGYRSALAAHIETIRRAAESVSVPLIASLNGITREGWTGIAADLEEAGAAALELSLFHIPTDLRETSAEVEDRLIETVREVCKAVSIPVAVKLSPNFTAPAHLASALADAGAKGIVLFNRWYEPDIDLETLTFHPALRLSTAEEIRLPLMWVALLSGKTSLSLAGGRGVEGPDEVVKYLLAGADVVLTASSLLRHGPKHLGRTVNGLADWLAAHGASSVGEIRGRMRAERLVHPEALMRAQYVHTLLRDFPILLHVDSRDGLRARAS
jgi:dihydroorotate dehydrogenase (fumarate)